MCNNIPGNHPCTRSVYLPLLRMVNQLSRRIKEILKMNIKEVAMGIATGFLMMSTGLFLGGCGNRSKLDSADVEGFDTIVLYVNSVKGHKEDSTIVGYFVKGKLDTLFFRSIPPWEEEMENGENNYHSVVYSSNPDIPRFDIYNNIYPCFVNEGDLDGNGTTDFGILDHGIAQVVECIVFIRSTRIVGYTLSHP